MSLFHHAPRSLTKLVPLSLLAVGVAFPVTDASAAVASVSLGTASSFAVLAGSGITNTGPTTIIGDVGTFPTVSETGFVSVTLVGTDHGGDAVTQQARTTSPPGTTKPRVAVQRQPWPPSWEPDAHSRRVQLGHARRDRHFELGRLG